MHSPKFGSGVDISHKDIATGISFKTNDNDLTKLPSKVKGVSKKQL